MSQTALKRPEELLSEAAARLKRQSPGMTLRGVAGRLAISPSYWSKILRGQKPLTPALLPNVVKVLALDTQAVAQLQRSILSQIESKDLKPVTGLSTRAEEASSPTDGYRALNRSEFWMLESWYIIPILNLFTVDNFIPTTEAIGFRLGLAPEVVSEAIARLKTAGYLLENEGGVITRSEMKLRFPTERTAAPIRQYHTAMMQKAKEELQNTQDARFDQRLISAVCFAGSSEKLKEARLILEEAMYKAANLMADVPQSDEIYQLNLQFFPLSKRPFPK